MKKGTVIKIIGVFCFLMTILGVNMISKNEPLGAPVTIAFIALLILLIKKDRELSRNTSNLDINNIGTAKICRYCKKEIPYKARVCPYCTRTQLPRGWTITILVVLILLPLFLFANCVNSVGELYSDVHKTQTATSNNLGDKTKKEKEADKSVKLGKFSNISPKLKLKVTSATEKTKLIHNNVYYSEPDSGGKFIVVNITIKNTGKNSSHIESNDFNLQDTDGSKYVPTDIIVSDDYLIYDVINPKMKLDTKIVFQVPKKTRLAKLKLLYHSDDKKYYFDLT